MVLSLKLDENLPVDARLLIEECGHEVQTALEEGLGGSPDHKIAERCREEFRILITLDKGFADIRTYPPDSHPGILLLRPARQSVSEIIKVLRDALDLADEESPDSRLWIVEPGRIRIRR
jgi:predicted nuclease of predicted toxin-antitoxin system